MAHPTNHPHPPYPTKAALDGIRRPTAPDDTRPRETRPTDPKPACHMKGRWF